MKASRTAVAVATAGLVVLAGCADDGSVTEPPEPPAAQEPAEEASTAQAEPATPQPPEPSEEPTEPSAQEPTAEEPAEPTSEEPSSEEPTGEAPEELEPTTGVTAFGGTATTTNGLQITIETPEDFTPDDTAAGGDTFDQHITFTMTVVNAGSEPYDQYLMTDLESDGAMGDQVFDVANDLNGTPSGTLEPGDEWQYDLGFGVEDPQDITVMVNPGYGNDMLTFDFAGD